LTSALSSQSADHCGARTASSRVGDFYHTVNTGNALSKRLLSGVLTKMDKIIVAALAGWSPVSQKIVLGGVTLVIVSVGIQTVLFANLISWESYTASTMHSFTLSETIRAHSSGQLSAFRTSLRYTAVTYTGD
jgi:hypothetical protein